MRATKSPSPKMTKLEVLWIFAKTGGYLKPDNIINQLRPVPDRRSWYSYLARLKNQGLLERSPDHRKGHLAYCLTARGRARIEYLVRAGRR
jgi:hypothetical protein